MTIRSLPLITAAVLLVSCGSADTEHASPRSVEDEATSVNDVSEMSVAEEFFADLPRAAEVPEGEMGELYFNLLTRLTSKIDAIRDEDDLANASAYLQYVRNEVDALLERSEAMPIEKRRNVFEDGVATIDYARSQYSRALTRLAEEHPSLASELGDLASAQWPLLFNSR